MIQNYLTTLRDRETAVARHLPIQIIFQNILSISSEHGIINGKYILPFSIYFQE